VTSAPTEAARSQTTAQKVIGAAYLAVLLVAFAGLFSTHLPSPLGVRVSQILALGAALLILWQSREGGTFSFSNPKFRARAEGNWLLRRGWLRVPLMALFMSFATFLAVEDGVLALVTAVAGQPGSRTVTITGTDSFRRGCDYFEIREVGFLLNRALCADSDQLALGTPGSELILYGRRSAFGLNVSAYAVRPGPDAR
jgi:hypothetical protein